MNKKELLETLKSYRGLHAERERLRRRIADKKGEMYDIQAVIVNASVSHSGEINDKVERVVEQVDSMVHYYLDKVMEAEKAEQNIIHLIEQISDRDSRMILFLRYIEGKTMEEISEILAFSVRNTWYRYNAALEEIVSSVS